MRDRIPVFFLYRRRTPEIRKRRYPHGGLSGSIDLGKSPVLSVVRGTPFRSEERRGGTEVTEMIKCFLLLIKGHCGKHRWQEYLCQPQE